jgi:hypothetical protein
VEIQRKCSFLGMILHTFNSKGLHGLIHVKGLRESTDQLSKPIRNPPLESGGTFLKIVSFGQRLCILTESLLKTEINLRF